MLNLIFKGNGQVDFEDFNEEFGVYDEFGNYREYTEEEWDEWYKKQEAGDAEVGTDFGGMDVNDEMLVDAYRRATEGNYWYVNF